MSNNKLKIGVDSTNAFAKWYDANDTSNAQVTMINEKADSGDSTFKIKKMINATNTDVMEISNTGEVTFKQNVKFNGGSTTVNSVTTSIEDTQLELGLSNSLNITAVAISGSNPYDYKFTTATDQSSSQVGTTCTFDSGDDGSGVTYGADDVWTIRDSNGDPQASGLSVNDAVIFTSIGSGADGTNISSSDANSTIYFVKTLHTTTNLSPNVASGFTLSATKGGTALTGTADSSGTWVLAKLDYNIGNYVYFQNAKTASGTDFAPLTDKTLMSACYISNVHSLTQFTINAVDASGASSGNITNDGQTSSTALDISAYPPTVSKLSTITNNTGLHILGVDNNSLVSASLSYDNSSDKNLVLKNDDGEIILQNDAYGIKLPITKGSNGEFLKITSEIGSGSDIYNTEWAATTGEDINGTFSSITVGPNDGNDATIDTKFVSGTDTAGKDLTISAGQGTGTGAGGEIIFQVADGGGSSGSSLNALATALTIKDDKTLEVEGIVNLNNTTSSSSTTTGALIVDGGVGIAENTHIGGTLDVTGDTSVSTFDSTGATSLATSSGAVNIASSGAATTVKGTLNVDEAVTFDTTLDVTGDTSVSTFDSTGATSLATSSGAVNIASSGAATTVKGTLNVDEAVTFDTTLDVTGDTSVSTFDSSGATSLATSSGAVNIASSGAATTVKGTLNVDEAVTFDTTLDVTGDTSVSTFDSTGATSLATSSGAVNIASSGAATTVKGTLNVDEAVTFDTTLDVTGDTSVSTFDSTGATSLATSSGAVNIASSGAATTVKGTLNVDEAVTFDTTLDVTGIVNLNNTTSSSSTTTGALIVDGGVGIAENTHIGGTLDVTGDTSVSTFDSSGATSLATSSGAVNIASSGAMTTVKGTLNVDEAVTFDTTLDVTGIVNLNNTTSSSSTTTGALIVDGGVGIAENTHIGGTLDVTGDTSVSTFDSTGATSLATSSGAVNIASSGAATTVKGTLNVDEAVTFDTTLDVTGDTSVSTFDSTGATSLATSSGAVNIASSGAATTVKGTLNVDEAVTFDTTLDVTGDTSVSTFDSTGATSLATSSGAVNIASSGAATTVKGTLNVDEAVTFDTTLDVTGDTSVSTFDSTGATSLATSSGAVNIASSGAATTVKGTLNVDEAVTFDTTLDVTGIVNLNNTTSSSSTTTGALIVDGGVGIAENTHIGGTLDVTGELTSSSDRRLKTNIVNLDNSLEIIKNLNGVNFNWIKDNDNGRLQTGFIAQDVEVISPELVKEKEDGYKAVNYIGVIPHLVEAIKEQQKIIEELKAKIENK